jgi:hypothetical protein
MLTTSVSRLTKGTVDSGANLDVGGLSGSEMINRVVSILFGDGTTASETIASDGLQCMIATSNAATNCRFSHSQKVEGNVAKAHGYLQIMPR